MGTRADFWVGRESADGWLGSIAWDGYPEGITPHDAEMVRGIMGRLQHKDGEWPEGGHLFQAKTEAEFRERVERFFQYREDVTRPADGWPWPWEDSRTTDYAYVWENGRVVIYGFGALLVGDDDETYEQRCARKVEFPDMKAVQRVVLGSSRSGVIVLSVPPE